MKIEMQDLPKVRDALDKLILDQHNYQNLTTNGQPEDKLRVVGEGGHHEGELTREELAEIFEKRIEDNLKFLRQRYQIDFNQTSRIDVVVNVNHNLGGTQTYSATGTGDDLGPITE